MSTKQIRLRTPITYYGGKQNLVRTIIPLIPEHKLYCEPFCGGAAIFFGKEKSEAEVLNDTNRELINFYSVCKNRFHDLSSLVRVTLHSREDHDNAWIIYNKPQLFDEVRRAWAVWVLSSQSFSGQLDGNWGYERDGNTMAKKITNRKEEFAEALAMRMQNVQVECADACYVIKSRDFDKAFFYIDPPYFNSCMGHYDGYTINDFEELLKLLVTIKGKFLLSSYSSDILNEYAKANGWYQKFIEQKVSVSKDRQKKKVEVLTANYLI